MPGGARIQTGMPMQTVLTKRLGIACPIIQAPLAGGGDTPELVSAVSKAGGLGSIGAAYLTPAEILEAGRAVRASTDRPFAVNLFAPLPLPEPRDAAPVLARVAPFFEELGLNPPAAPQLPANSFDAQLEAALETGASVFSFTFGLLTPDAIARIRNRGLLIMGTATTVEEALALERSGADAVIAQGSEAGGHRGTFLGEFDQGMIGTISLVPQVADAVSIPVVASGGIMDGRGIAAALALGASAVQIGTAFLTCHESGIPEAYRNAILTAREDGTRVTRAFSGRPARGIVNRFMTEFESGNRAEEILPFPLQNALTRPLRSAAAKQDRAEFLSLWAGQGLRMARRQSAAEVMARLDRETKDAIGQIQNAIV